MRLYWYNIYWRVLGAQATEVESILVSAAIDNSYFMENCSCHTADEPDHLWRQVLQVHQKILNLQIFFSGTRLSRSRR